MSNQTEPSLKCSQCGEDVEVFSTVAMDPYATERYIASCCKVSVKTYNEKETIDLWKRVEVYH